MGAMALEPHSDLSFFIAPYKYSATVAAAAVELAE